MLEPELMPTQERYQHDILERAVGSKHAPVGDNPPMRVRSQRMIDRYRIRRQISRSQFRAAEQLYREWRASGSEPRMTPRYGGVHLVGRSDADEHQAVMRHEGTMTLIDVGLMASAILVHVVLLDLAAGDWAIARNYPKSAGIVMLKEALNVLRLHYRQRRRREISRLTGTS